ncbi:MAG: HIT family protein [Nanoarchaeota archaeon]|nr:HIT family protein [Nanoarchaeota archaeon]
MTDCDVCKILENKKEFRVIYEDDICFAILHENPVVPGHAMLITKEHYPILEEVPDKTCGIVFSAANKISAAMFDTMGLSGTNIIVNNGTTAGQDLPHFFINIIPRKEGDGINFEWTPKKVADEKLETTYSMIKSFAEPVFNNEKVNEVEIIEEELPLEDEEDYEVLQLKRMP